MKPDELSAHDVITVRTGMTCRVMVIGALDAGSAPAFRQAVVAALQASHIVLVDLIDTTAIDSGGLWALADVVADARAADVWLAATGPPFILETITDSGMLDTLPFITNEGDKHRRFRRAHAPARGGARRRALA